MNRQFPTYLLSVSLCSFSAYFAPKRVFFLRSFSFIEQYCKRFRCLEVYYRDVMSEIRKASFTQQ